MVNKIMNGDDLMIHCSLCQKELKDKELVVLDILNGITHKLCYVKEPYFSMKDTGSYRFIKNKYDIFLSVRTAPKLHVINSTGPQ